MKTKIELTTPRNKTWAKKLFTYEKHPSEEKQEQKNMRLQSPASFCSNNSRNHYASYSWNSVSNNSQYQNENKRYVKKKKI